MLPKSTEPSERIPDPAALAQGHRLSRAVRGLLMPAWVFGLLTLLMLGAQSLEQQPASVALGLLLMFVIAGLFTKPRSLASTVGARVDSRVPGELHEVLAVSDGLIEQLERGQDWAFSLDLMDLGIALDRLRPSAYRYLEERGVDPARLRDGLCTSAEPVKKLSIEDRRALHRDLVQFVAAARGRPCGDPYRSRMIGAVALLEAMWDPALARTRRLYGAAVALVAAAWLGAWLGIATWKHGVPLDVCNPFARGTPCRLAFGLEDLAFAKLIALSLAPLFLLGLAALTRAAAWRSWAAALPEPQLDSPSDESPIFAKHRRRLLRRTRVQRWLRLSSLVLAAACTVGYGDPNWATFELGAVLIAAGLIALTLVVIPALANAMAHRSELRALDRRLAKLGPTRHELLTELCAARLDLAAATPPRAEQLEQLADTLARADQLGALELADRDRVVARLRTAASRGSALRREQRDRLVLDVQTCELLLARGRPQ